MRRIRSDTRQGCTHHQGQTQSFFAYQGFDLACDIKDERSQVDRLGMNLKAPCRHLREIQHLIHEMSQMISGCFNSLNRLYLPRRKLTVDSFSEEIHKTYYCIQWRPELVGHICQKLAFH